MRKFIVVLSLLVWSSTAAVAQLSIGIGFPTVSIGINVGAYPRLVPIPGYPVYYAPQMASNYFFYDGMYWVLQEDNWYASTWYNGPWGLVAPDAVPVFILRVPVRYYRQPPAYFRGWRVDASPRWGEHWGNGWEQSHRDWDRWNRSATPAAAPLPSYQRQYSGARYPRAEQQQELQRQQYRYQPQDAVVQRHFQAQQVQPAQAQRPERQDANTRTNPSRQTREPSQRMPLTQTAIPDVPQRPAQQPAAPPVQVRQPSAPPVQVQQPRAVDKPPPGKPSPQAAKPERDTPEPQGGNRGSSNGQGNDRNRGDAPGNDRGRPDAPGGERGKPEAPGGERGR